MIQRDEALTLLKEYLKNDNLVKHSLAVEAIMTALAKHLSENSEVWGLTGLLHDIDYEYTKDDPTKHGKIAPQILHGLIPESGINAIISHNYLHTDYIPTSSIDKAILAADAISGLLIATALIIPSKKIGDVQLSTVQNKYHDKSFARGCDRTKISVCTDLGVNIDVFLELSLHALKEIATDLGL